MLKKVLIYLIICGLIGGGISFSHAKNIDLNDDGIINICDVQQLISEIISDNPSLLSDINNDGKIDIKDLQILMKNMGTKHKTMKVRADLLGYIPKINYNSYKPIKKESARSGDKNFSSYKINNMSFYTHLYNMKRGDNNEFVSLFKLYGDKFLASHLGAKSPPID